MAIIVKPFTFVPRTTIRSAQVNSDFDTLYNDYNGNITDANISISAGINPAKIGSGTFAATSLTVSGTIRANQFFVDAQAWLGQSTSQPGGEDIALFAGNQERLTVSNIGRVSIGTTVSAGILNWHGVTYGMNSGGDAVLDLKAGGSGVGGRINLSSARNTYSSPNIVQNGDVIGSLYFYGYDGSVFREGASILAQINGTPGAGDMPTALLFRVTADGAASPTTIFTAESSGLSMQSGKDIVLTSGRSLRFDGSFAGTNYIGSFGSNTVSLVAGGVAVDISPTAANFGNRTLQVTTTNYVYLNAGGTTAIRDFSGELSFRVGGLDRAFINTSGELLLPDVDPPTANYANRNGIVKGYIVYDRGSGIIRASYNVASVTNGGTGTFTVNWARPFASNHYAITTSLDFGGYVQQNSRTSSSLMVSMNLIGGAQFNGECSIIAIGDQ